MAKVVRTEIFEKIQNDIRDYQGRRDTVRAGIIERITVREVDPLRLHANPNDEFCQDDVGPNYSIMNRYCKEIKRCMKSNDPIFKEPVMVQKMKDGDYLILNGHHRWAAAVKMMVPKIRIIIVNPRSKKLKTKG